MKRAATKRYGEARPKSKTPLVTIFLCILVLGVTVNAWPDYKPYSGEKHLSIESGGIRVTHVHSRKNGRPWYDARIESFSDCNYSHNNQGVMQAFRGSERLFCRAVPALTDIWISSDEKYIVGLSDIKFSNPYQIIVVSNTGGLLFRRSIRCTDTQIGGCSESVTNRVNWYRKELPGIRIIEGVDRAIELSLNSPDGSRISFAFPSKPERPLDMTPCGRDWGEMTAEAYWFNYVQGHVSMVSEAGEYLCVSVHESRGENYHYMHRALLSDRNAKEEVFLMFLDIARGYLGEAEMTAAAAEQVRAWLKRIAGIDCINRDQCMEWLTQHQGDMMLSDDGQFLVEKASGR